MEFSLHVDGGVEGEVLPTKVLQIQQPNQPACRSLCIKGVVAKETWADRGSALRLHQQIDVRVMADEHVLDFHADALKGESNAIFAQGASPWTPRRRTQRLESPRRPLKAMRRGVCPREDFPSAIAPIGKRFLL